MRELKIAIAGNPNCGKTTLFNALTGYDYHVGNWPGVTVERKEGVKIHNGISITFADLPGVYSLSPSSAEEKIARDFLVSEKPDVILNVTDATNLERSLYLTTQLAETGLPMVVALNMTDRAAAAGISIDSRLLEKKTGIPVMPISASRKEGIDKLLDRLTASLEPAREIVVYDWKTEDKIQRLKNDMTRLEAVQVLESDAGLKGIGEERYRAVSRILKGCLRKRGGERNISDEIDRILLDKYLALPIFLLFMFIMFEVTFGSVGGALSDYTNLLVNGAAARFISRTIEAAGASPWTRDMLVDGLWSGMGGVMVFFPQVMLMFLFLSLFEDSGYMARAAFILDRLFVKIGLSGKAFMPMLIGFGCSAVAVAGCRTLENEKDRRLAVILTPFMSCGARMPVYALLAGAFFEKNRGVYILGIYLTGVAVAALSGFILSKTVLRGEQPPFIIELPPYRLPRPGDVFKNMYSKAKDFVLRVATVLAAASVILWLMQNFDFTMQKASSGADSMIGVTGRLIAPLFAPLGFGRYEAVAALVAGIVAKETVVASLGIALGAGEAGLGSAVRGVFTPLSALSFMVFTLLYMPCVAAVKAIGREMNSLKWTVFAVLYQTLTAYAAAFLVFQIGRNCAKIAALFI